MLEGLKRQVREQNQRLFNEKLVKLTFGNLSAIDSEKGLVAIKPSGVPFQDLKDEDIVIVDLQGNIVEGDKRPSSDLPTHLEIYKAFPEIKSIVHTHSIYATTFSQAKIPLTCTGTTHADTFYGTIPLTRELTPEEINQAYESNTGKLIIEIFQKQKLSPTHCPACLVVSHGPFIFGTSPEKAIDNAIILEEVAKIQYFAKTLNPGLWKINQDLLDKHFKRKHGSDAYYGQEP